MKPPEHAKKQVVKKRGFDLLELLIALAIVLLVVGSAFEFYRGYLKSEQVSRVVMRAISLAKSVESRLGHDLSLEEGQGEGKEAAYIWRYTSTPLPQTHITQAQLYQVKVTVVWNGGRQFTLETVKRQ